MGLIWPELIPNKRRDTRFNAARPESNQRQADIEKEQLSVRARCQVAAGQDSVTRAVKERHPQDGIITPDDLVRKPRAKQRHEIIGELERVDHAGSHVGALAQPTFGNLAADVAREDAGHPIVAEPFAGFISDYEFDLLRP